jgi:hypothetical protein
MIKSIACLIFYTTSILLQNFHLWLDFLCRNFYIIWNTAVFSKILNVERVSWILYKFAWNGSYIKKN